MAKKKKQYQKLYNTYQFDKIIEKEKPTFEKYNRSNLIYSGKHSFHECYNIKTLIVFHLRQISRSFYSDLNKFNNLNPPKGSIKEKNTTVYDNAPEIYNEYL